MKRWLRRWLDVSSFTEMMMTRDSINRMDLHNQAHLAGLAETLDVMRDTLVRLDNTQRMIALRLAKTDVEILENGTKAC